MLYIYYSHRTSSLSSTFVSWILASFVTWQRSVWSWSAGESKSVKRDELAKLAEPVWLLLFIPIELRKIKIPLRKKKRRIIYLIYTVELIYHFYTIQTLVLDKHVH